MAGSPKEFLNIAVNHWERHPESAVHTPMGGVLSAAQNVANLTNDPDVGGASADLRSLKAYEPGSPHYMVGSAPDVRTGKPFPTQQVDYGAANPKATVRDIMNARDKMLPAATGRKQPILGTWNVNGSDHPVENRRVDIDLGTAFDRQNKAEDFTLKRNEDAYFNMKNMTEKSNERIRYERGLGPRKPKGPKQEEIVRRHGE